MDASNRRPVWDASCCSLDVVLWMTFTADELASELERYAITPVSNDTATREVSIFVPAHQVCRGPSCAADHLTHRLDDRYAEALAWVEDAAPGNVQALCLGAVDELPFALPALLWAILRDPRPQMRAPEAMLVWRAQTEGLRALSFGKVELISVA